MDAFGLEEGDYLVDAMQRSSVERRVLGECSTGVNAHDFEAQDFLLELKGDF